jgi:glyoxylase-like metal-dependent hydrolase (beta-lactamase superfamily II)
MMNQILKESLPNVWTWSFFSEEKKINFNGLLIFNDGLWVLIDPPPASPEILNEIGQKKIAAIFLTNSDHERMSPDCKRMTGAPLWIHENDAPSLEEVKADRLFRDGDLLPGGFQVIHLQDQKTPGESAFYLEERRILILGDALIGPQSGKLRNLPPEKYADFSKARQGLRRLLEIDFDALFIGDGFSIPKGGRALVEALFRSLEEVRT